MERLWAPWRLQYVTDTAPKKEGCFLCNAWEEQNEDEAHLVLYRGKNAFIIMNRYPYNNGHIMIAPVRHFGDFTEPDESEILEMWQLTSFAKKVMCKTMSADGFNIGVNQGKCAGAGVLDHLHIHIVPRWNGDVNFMPVMADIKVMPQALNDCYKVLRAEFDKGII